MNFRKLTYHSVLLAGMAVSGAAQAALVACPGSFTTDGTAKVYNNTTDVDTAASACQYMTPADTNNVASITNINTAGFFGFTDWASNGQDQLGGAGSTGQSGTWSIANYNFSLYDYIIVFKDGAGTNLTAFLFNELFASGGWSTPFVDPPFEFTGESTSKDVSHYTIAKRQAGTPVPEPISLALMGIGLLGLGAARRFGKKST